MVVRPSGSDRAQERVDVRIGLTRESSALGPQADQLPHGAPGPDVFGFEPIHLEVAAIPDDEARLAVEHQQTL
jgi:hypothetical protein